LASIEDRLIVDRLEAKPAKLVDAPIEIVALERTGRGNDGDAVA
jgi:hypothetical protein